MMCPPTYETCVKHGVLHASSRLTVHSVALERVRFVYGSETEVTMYTFIHK